MRGFNVCLDDMKLFFTQHLIRHGDRTGFSDSCWPGDHINVVCDINFDEIPTDENDKYYHAGLLFRKTYEQGQTTYVSNENEKGTRISVLMLICRKTVLVATSLQRDFINTFTTARSSAELTLSPVFCRKN